MVKMKKIIMKKELKGWSSPATAFLSNKENDRLLHKQFHSWYLMITGKHKIMSKLATQSFHILRLIAWNQKFSRPKVQFFNVSRLSRQSCALWAVSKSSLSLSLQCCITVCVASRCGRGKGGLGCSFQSRGWGMLTKILIPTSSHLKGWLWLEGKFLMMKLTNRRQNKVWGRGDVHSGQFKVPHPHLHYCTPTVYLHAFTSSTPQLYLHMFNFEQSVVIQLDFDVAAEMNWDGGDFEDLSNCSTNEPGVD